MRIKMGLFKPIWMTDKSKKKNKALQAVGNIFDQSLLKDIAIHAPLKSVGLAACERVTSEHDLADIALSIHDVFKIDICVAAVKRITDPDLSYTIVRDCEWENVKSYVIGNLRDLDKLYELDQLYAKRHVELYLGRAIGNVTNAKAIYRFLKRGKFLKGIDAKLKLLEKDDLLSLASDSSVDKVIRQASCEIIGHIRKVGCFRCVCDRCGKKLSHEFDSENICKYCKGKATVEHIPEKVTDRWGREHPATGMEHKCYVTYPDGEKELYWRRHDNIVADHGGIPIKR